MTTQTININTQETNKVLSQTYQFLSITLIWATFVAFLSMATNFTSTIAGMGNSFIFVFLGAYFLNLFLIQKNKDNGMGVFFTFTLTGLLGLTLSPMLHYAIGTDNSSAIVLALGGTAISFFGASTYGKTTDKDLSGLGKYLFIGILAAFIMGLVNVFFIKAGVLSMALSGVWIVLSTLLIAYQIQAIVKGGERNYVLATVTLFVSIYNIFSSLLHLILNIND